MRIDDKIRRKKLQYGFSTEATIKSALWLGKSNK